MRQAVAPKKLKAVYAALAHRYDFQHGALTLGADQRGRRLVVEQTVRKGDKVLDAGAGTGSTALLAARRAGNSGHVTLFDWSADMLDVARTRARERGLEARLDFRCGDMFALPFADGTFDTVLSTYSICPLFDPQKGAMELYRSLSRADVWASPTPFRPKNRFCIGWRDGSRTPSGRFREYPWAAARSPCFRRWKKPARATCFRGVWECRFILSSSSS